MGRDASGLSRIVGAASVVRQNGRPQHSGSIPPASLAAGRRLEAKLDLKTVLSGDGKPEGLHAGQEVVL
jgi:hypothetical protein